MSVYATLADFRAYPGAPVEADLDDAAAEALLERADRDIDFIFGPLAYRADNGRKLLPSSLTDAQAEALSNATIVQAIYLNANPAIIAGTRRAKSEKGPDFEVTYADEDAAASGRYAPALAVELAPLAPLRRLTGFLR
jgi:hypothetical protein